LWSEEKDSHGNAPESAQDVRYHFAVKVELVGLFASVFDHSGKLVTGLDRDDFVLYDGGMPQVISRFSRDYIPLSVVILLDTSGSMGSGDKLANARKSLVYFMKRLNPGDEAMLLEFRHKPRIVLPFTGNFRKIERLMKDLDGNGSTALYDAIIAALGQAQLARNRRRAILLISDGINTYGKARLEDSVVSLRRHGVELFAIGLEAEPPEGGHTKVDTRSVLDILTRSAGGESYVVSDSKDLRKICHMISEQMHNQYSFGYYPPETREGEWRAVKLETKSRGLRVVASKTGYYASAAD